jgi:hypothetical protein
LAEARVIALSYRPRLLCAAPPPCTSRRCRDKFEGSQNVFSHPGAPQGDRTLPLHQEVGNIDKPYQGKLTVACYSDGHSSPLIGWPGSYIPHDGSQIHWNQTNTKNKSTWGVDEKGGHTAPRDSCESVYDVQSRTFYQIPFRSRHGRR